jgi:hypothetical protein
LIKEALFPQPWIEEPEDPIYEINPCTTSFIKDLPQAMKDKLDSCTGSRRITQKRFNIANKVVGK